MSRRSRTLVNAFNVVPVVEKILPDRPKVEVGCLCVWEQCLYIGTQCGLVIYYVLEEHKTPLKKVVFQSKIKGRVQLGAEKLYSQDFREVKVYFSCFCEKDELKSLYRAYESGIPLDCVLPFFNMQQRKPVQQLTVLPTHKKLLALVEGFLHVMHMSSLELCDTGQRISRIQTYTINESKSAQTSTGNLEIIVAPQKRKLLQMYALTGDKLIHMKDFPIPEPALVLSRDDESVCAALAPGGSGEGRYMVLNIAEGKTTDLLGYEEGTCPLIRRTGRGEFLLNTGSFGIVAFVATGGSNRPPVDWSANPPKAACYIFPYVVVWSQATGNINVYNILDQKCVQEINFQNGRFLSDFSGRLYGALDRSIYTLPQVPLREQVTNLLEKQLVEEAVLLAETIAAVEATRDPRVAEDYVCEVKQRAAFIYFSMGAFSQAEVLFQESGCDPREVITLFDHVLPISSNFIPQTPSLHSLPSVQALADAGQLSFNEARKFLIRYLKEIRSTPLVLGRKEDIDTSLVKLLAEDRSPSLIPYLENHELHLAFEDTRNALDKYSCYHALGLLYYYSNQTSTALSLWTRISDDELKDKLFPGFPFIVDFLSKHNDPEIVLKWAQWALKNDEQMAVHIFTEREMPLPLPPTKILEFLSPFPSATVSYLEHSILHDSSKDEGFHTKLASLYIEDVLKLLGEDHASQRLKSAREKLLSFLESSQHYLAPVLLSKVHDTELYRECALLYGRMEEHEKALTLLAHKLKDFKQAEEYCCLYSQERSRLYKQNLFQLLLSVYLQPKDKSHDTLIRPALSLLNSHGAAFNAAQVLECLPPDWPIKTVKAFLLHSLRSNIHTFRMERIQHNLARGENLQLRHEFIQLQGGPVVITETTRCPVCNLPFNDAAFVRYPNGTVTHLKCGKNKTICPVTGTWFSGN